MDVKVSILKDSIDLTSNLPIPHLSFIINFLLPKWLVGIQRTERLFKDFESVIEKEPSFLEGHLKPILVGSTAESYNIPDVLCKANNFSVETMSDGDILLESSSFVVETKNIESLSASDQKPLILDYNDIHPGYGRLQLKAAPEEDDAAFIHDHKTQKYYLSGLRLQAKTLKGIPEKDNFQLHGPALSGSISENKRDIVFDSLESGSRSQIHDQDYVLAIRCRQWPNIAQSWIKRQEERNWLTWEQAQSIVEKGIHLVPVAHKLSSNPDLEWRLSFAEAEVYLAHNVITDEQRQCYVFLKIIYVQTLKQLELLSSYHLKTIFLYSCEQLPLNAWIEASGSCLVYMLDMVIECVSNKFLPSFFIPENNLIDHFTDSETSRVLEKLRSVRKSPLSKVLEFTDANILCPQIVTVPFNVIISSVLKDMEEYLIDRNIQRATTLAFPLALLEMVRGLAYEGRPEEAMNYVLEIYPIISKHSPSFTSISQIVNVVALHFLKDIQRSIGLIEEALKYSDSYPDLLWLRGNLACMYHALAYSHPVDSEDRKSALRKAESLFQTVVDVEDFSFPAAVDFVWLLVKQNRFDEAKEKLESVIEAKREQTTNMNEFNDKEAPFLDEYIQNEVKTHGLFSVNSMSMAYYLLVKCVVKNNLSSAEESVYQKILQHFTIHCGKLNESSSHSLLGYAYKIVGNFLEALKSFDKALSTCDGNDKLIKENIELCKLCLLE